MAEGAKGSADAALQLGRNLRLPPIKGDDGIVDLDATVQRQRLQRKGRNIAASIARRVYSSN
jgi:hypothetical protein